MNWIVLIWLLAVTQVSVNHVYCVSRDQATKYATAGRLMFQLARYSRYRDTLYESNTLHNLMSGVIQLLKNTNERFICVPGESPVKTQLICKWKYLLRSVQFGFK
ncbi:hypothetical protein CSKR_107608 [Clonorchis sinensis]|uniref:Uncharacterized protein n=1 Tax=Clonorchis sinensis TaxID=79923 RepID=A0A419PY18_CLOSI|nr:hypothetical protein CSKR_107608 [Clonorchis sinensis]